MIKRDVQNAQRILVVNLGGIGDFLLSTPALRLLKSHYSGAKLVFLGVPRVCDLAKSSGLFDEVFALDIFDAAARHFVLAKIEKVFVAASVLRARKFDMAINMRTIVSWPSAWKMHLLFRLINATTWVGRDTDRKGYFFHVKVPETLRSDKHEMQHDLEMIAALGVDIRRPVLLWDVDPAAMRHVEQDLSSEGIRPFDPIIGIHVGGAPSRRWPIASVLRVTKELRQTYGCRVVLIGGSTDKDVLRGASDMTALDVVDRIERYSLAELIAFISRCRLFIGNDSGPMHIAAVLKVPLVAIFGGGDLGRYDPRKISDKAQVLYEQVSCAPCDRFACRSMRCLSSITPKDVMNAVNRVMQR